MIDSSIKIEFLKPEIWTNLGTVLAPLINTGKILHILDKGSGVYKALTSDHQNFSLEAYVKGQVLSIDDIFVEFSDIIEIRVYTPEGLINYYSEIQKATVYQQDIDDYFIGLYNAQEDGDGIKIYKRNSQTMRCYMERLKTCLKGEIDNAVVFVWLTDNDKLYFNCILEFLEGKLTCLSTSDRYPDADENYESIYGMIKKEYDCKIIPVRMELKDYLQKAKEIWLMIL